MEGAGCAVGTLLTVLALLVILLGSPIEQRFQVVLSVGHAFASGRDGASPRSPRAIRLLHLPLPRHLLPHQRAPPDVRPPVILTVIPDVASKQISQCSLNMLTLTILDIPAILPEIPVLL